MNARIVLGLSLMGLLAASFASFAAHANGNKTVSKAEIENRHVIREVSPGPGRIAIAIGKFENRCNAPDEIFKEIRTRIQQCVAGTMKFEVLDRERLREIIREQMLAAASVTNREVTDVPVAGKIKPASYIIYGKVLSCGADKHVADIGGSTYAFVKSEMELDVTIANCKTGNIMAMKTVVGHGRETAMVSGGAKSSAGRGMRDAIDEAGHAVADWLRDVFACPAKVLKVDKAEITIDMNENEVKEGDLFDVIAEGGVMVDPDSGAALEIDGKCIGRVVITRPGLQTSKAEPVDGGRLSLEKLDVSKHTYKLRRVTKTVLMKEAKKRARKVSHEY